MAVIINGDLFDVDKCLWSAICRDTRLHKESWVFPFWVDELLPEAFKSLVKGLICTVFIDDARGIAV